MRKSIWVLFVVVCCCFPVLALAYTNPQLITCEEIVYGDEVLDNDGNPMYNHWDRQCINPKTVFEKGDRISILAKANSMVDNYRFMIGIYKGDLSIWEEPIEFDWNIVMGEPHLYGSMPFNLESIFVGDYTVKVWIKNVDDDHSYILFDQLDIQVKGEAYYDPNIYICEAWEYGSSDQNAFNYWDLQPINIKNYFLPGDIVCILSIADDITQKHRWIRDISFNGDSWPTAISDWHDVGVGWTYTSDPPCFRVYNEGTYKVKMKLDVEVGIDYQNEQIFIVGDNPPPIKNNIVPLIMPLLLGK